MFPNSVNSIYDLLNTAKILKVPEQFTSLQDPQKNNIPPHSTENPPLTDSPARYPQWFRIFHHRRQVMTGSPSLQAERMSVWHNR